MNITNEAKQYIQSLLEEQQAKGLRILPLRGAVDRKSVYLLIRLRSRILYL